MFCGMYIVLVNGKLAENAAMNPFPHFFFIQPKKLPLYSSTRINMLTRAQRYKCIFLPENGKSRNYHCHVHYLKTKFKKNDLSL